jgi:FAD/FMN-containing dehydrogenase
MLKSEHPGGVGSSGRARPHRVCGGPSRSLSSAVLDKTSRAALIEGGTYGPALEAQLRPHSLTLRYFPQSFEYSTLGGWIATRGGGHFATLYTHIDDFVESLRTVTPRGVIESRRLPGSGAGPSPDRMMIGSEGILGVITQAWMRLQDRPTFRDGGALRFKDFFSAARAVRAELVWVRTDGRKMADDPGLLRQGKSDMATCSADLDSGTPTASAKGCMAVRGYALVRKDQAEELRAAYAAAARKGTAQDEQR